MGEYVLMWSCVCAVVLVYVCARVYINDQAVYVCSCAYVSLSVVAAVFLRMRLYEPI